MDLGAKMGSRGRQVSIVDPSENWGDRRINAREEMIRSDDLV